MQNSKLFTLLRTFSRQEEQAFDKFLRSPYFNENEQVVSLFDAVTGFLRRGSENPDLAPPSKEQLWNAIFKGQEFDDIQLRRLFSDTTQLALQFLAIEKFRDNPMGSQIKTLEAVNDPPLEKHFRGAVRQARRIQERTSLRNSEFHHFSYLLELQTHKQLEKLGARQDQLDHLRRANEHLDHFYLTQKLKHYCDLLGYKTLFSINEEWPEMEELLARLESSPALKVPSVHNYYLVCRMLQTPSDESHYFRIKTKLSEEAAYFDKEELQGLYTHLVNYCIYQKINKGQYQYYRELFSLYQIAIAKELLLIKGILPLRRYNNIILLGLQLEEYEWVEYFIKNNTSKINPAHQSNALTYNLALVAFHKEQYGEVIRLLSQVEYKHLSYSLGGKLLLLRTYYELQEFLALDSLIDSFRIYLRRNRVITKETKQQYLNALRFTKKLSNLHGADVQGVGKLKEQIEQSKAVASKKWLLEKVEELIG